MFAKQIITNAEGTKHRIAPPTLSTPRTDERRYNPLAMSLEVLM